MTKQYTVFYVVFCTLIAFMVWSISYGALLGILYNDTRILNSTLSTNPFAPIVQLWRYSGNSILLQVSLFALVPTLAVAGLVAYVGLREKTKPLGEAAFQVLADMRRANWFRKDGHIFGAHGRNILRVKDDRHHLIIGPTRSGKGAGYVIPNALMHVGSMLVTDLKGEIYTATAAYRRANGNEVFLFAPGQKDSHSWNPLDFIREDRGYRTIDIQNMASVLVPQTSPGDAGFWQAMAQRVAAGLISYIHESDFYKDRRNLGEVNSLLNASVPLQVLMRMILQREPYLSKFTKDNFNAYIALPEKTAGSAITELQNALAPFHNERIVAATLTTDIELDMMSRKPIIIYLAPNITDITLLRPLLTLFVQQVMNILTLEHNPKALPVYFLLDEFRQLKKMDEIMTKLPYVAGYNIKLAFIVQDISNIDEIYGEKARQSLLGNCGYQLILGANDQVTADYVSRALGKQTIRYQSESRTIELIGLPRRTKVEQIRERDLMMPQEVRKMASENFVLLIEGQSPILGRKLRYFETEPFKSAEAFAKANRPIVPEIQLPFQRPVPALTAQYALQEEASKTVPKTEKEPQVNEIAPAHDQQEDNIASSALPAPVIENITKAEEKVELKVLSAKKAVPTDLFAVEIAVTKEKQTSSAKLKRLEELKKTVVLDPL